MDPIDVRAYRLVDWTFLTLLAQQSGEGWSLARPITIG